jgi:hypothetical protein
MSIRTIKRRLEAESHRTVASFEAASSDVGASTDRAAPEPTDAERRALLHPARGHRRPCKGANFAIAIVDRSIEPSDLLFGSRHS